MREYSRRDKAMKISYRALFTMAVAFFLASCTTTGQSPTQVASHFINRENIVATTTERYPAKNPQTVALFVNDKAPHTAYRVIGVATISRYNLLGMQRKEDTLRDMMKNLAASIGGDGLINISSNREAMQASVIQFQKILI